MSVTQFSERQIVNVFGGSSLNRHNNERRDPNFLSLCLASPSARFVLFSSDLRIIASGLPPNTQLTLLPRRAAFEILGAVSPHSLDAVRCLSDANGVANDNTDVVFLGGLPSPEKQWCFAVKLPELDLETLDKVSRLVDDHVSGAEKRVESKFWNVRATGMALSNSQSAIAAHARSLFEFHRKHRFCGVCGAKTVSEQGGSRRRCSKNSGDVDGKGENNNSLCTGVWFPRIDPVAIVLVIDVAGDHCLLGRQERFPPGMYSCLAGFMEHGESVEDTARREVFEESGVRIGRCKYHSSQPWSFPYSLMLGVVAEAVSTQVNIDPHEIAEVRWFSRTQIKEMIEAGNAIAASGRRAGDAPELNPPLFCPPRMAIAHQLLYSYAHSEPITHFSPEVGPKL
eukprot:Plantae.Rhodophyta-Hildenbrandia_rubra.ctg26351.p1 GENE.Plantae.Rhodophyta-Hildenbrandia_rubra.ctg26351~~Plantae.Rhodophyta-Hildenbrandia_rubra.ctg26351.p1  ORF type:complete len:397 (+),score=53.86 Plantae.Rhodophyta-Hildenbrandia_rubra.ctg26351:132-1322(+)